MSRIVQAQVPFEPGATTYRAYALDYRGGIASVEILDARSDDEAVGKASVMANTFGIDLWERLRFLGSFPPHTEKE